MRSMHIKTPIVMLMKMGQPINTVKNDPPAIPPPIVFSKNTLINHKLYFSQLSMCQRQRPQSQITGSIGNTSQNEFNSLNYLMHENLSDFKFPVSVCPMPFLFLFNQRFLHLFISFLVQILEIQYNWFRE